jgi:hypothetical protein
VEVSTIDFTPFLVIAFLIALAVFAVKQVKAFHETPGSADNGTRSDQRIPADELALTGPDWRDPVRPYFQRRWESAVRTRAAVNHVCGIELPSPQTNRGRAGETADPTTKGDGSLGPSK